MLWDTETQPDNFRIVDLGRDWTRDALPSQLHVKVQFMLGAVDIPGKVGACAVGPRALILKETDLAEVGEGEYARPETQNEARERLYPVVHEQVGTDMEGAKLWLKDRLDVAVLKGLWNSLT